MTTIGKRRDFHLVSFWYPNLPVYGVINLGAEENTACVEIYFWKKFQNKAIVLNCVSLTPKTHTHTMQIQKHYASTDTIWPGQFSHE